MIDLALLLEAEGLNPEHVLVLRHCPSEADLNKVIGWLAEEEPDTFNMYQRSHSRRTEAAVSRARYVAAFIGHEAARAVFVGLYAVDGERTVTRTECNLLPLYRRLIDLGMSEWDETSPAQTALLFDLRLTDILARWKGRLVIRWPPPDRSWYRWGGRARNTFPVHAIHEDSLLSAAMPDWDRLILSWRELNALPASWRAELASWRGIYHVFDELDGKGYIGSAYGADNILGRWLNYASTGHGGNELLRTRNPENLVFSILQRLSPDMPADEVIAIESGWKTRLHTRRPYGLNGN